MAFLEWTFYSNTVRAWLIAATVAIVVLAAMRFVRWLVERQLRRVAAQTVTDLDDVAVEVLRRTRTWFLTIVAIWAGSMWLMLPERVRDALGTVAIIAALAQLGIWGTTAIRTWVDRQTSRHVDEDAARITSIRALGFIASVTLWAVVLLVTLDNLGIQITGLIASLGIGGIAVALAVQNILGDLFASLSIVLDKPFVYGDFIIVDDLMGTVEHVGLKTTRVRSLSGEQLVFSNSDLLKSRIRNFKRMFERRVVFSLGVIYQTPREKLERIPQMLTEIVEAQPDTRLDRAHFHKFGPSSLDFEVVYYVLVPDYNVYMDRQQAINLEIVRRFEAEGIEFAYPSQTVFVAEFPERVGQA